MARFCNKIDGGVYNSGNLSTQILVASGYTARESDIIGVTIRDANGNLKAWVEWDSSGSVWRVKVSDSSYNGMILYIIRTI